jgi:hypothetical protein
MHVNLSTSLHLSDLSDRGIPKAARMHRGHVLTPSGDLISAGTKRRQLLHLRELTI